MDWFRTLSLEPGMIPELTAFASSGILLIFILLLGFMGRRNPIIGKRIRILFLALLIQLVSDTVAYFDLPLHEFVSQGLIALLLLLLLLSIFLISVLKEFSLGWLSAKGGKVSKLITDVTVALIYVILILVLLKELFGINVTPLLATSAVLTMVLGLALQDTLANLIAGMVFHFENSIRIGDWLEYEGVIGEVRELSWRAVHRLGACPDQPRTAGDPQGRLRDNPEEEQGVHLQDRGHRRGTP
jgi:small-conductance mechanosensitive channel